LLSLKPAEVAVNARATLTYRTTSLIAAGRAKKGSKRGVSAGDKAPTSNSGSKPCGRGKGGCLRPGLSTEKEIQNAYDDELQTIHFDTIVGIQDLDEVELCGKSGKKSGGNRYGRIGGKKGIRGGTGDSKGGKKVRSYPVAGATHPVIDVTYPTRGAIKGSKGKAGS
jgi:hypothetical protein